MIKRLLKKLLARRKRTAYYRPKPRERGEWPSNYALVETRMLCEGTGTARQARNFNERRSVMTWE
jgi:hypothetical protein